MGVFFLKNLYNKHKCHIIYSIKLKCEKVILIFLLIIFNISFWITFKNVEKNFKPTVTSLSTSYSSTYAVSVINQSIKEVTDNKINYSDICQINKNDEGEIISITTNTSLINSIKLKLSNKIIENLRKKNSQDLGIPIGNLTKTYIFSGRGPKIPIKVMTASSPKIVVESKFESAGINQTKHKISIITTVEIQIILPYETLTTAVSSESLICDTIIIGNVPNVYVSK